jgi:hypothetical protein
MFDETQGVRSMGDKSPKANRRDDKQKSAVEEKESASHEPQSQAVNVQHAGLPPTMARLLSGLLHRPHAFRRVVRWRVDERRDFIGVQFCGGKRDEKPTKLSLGRGVVEPPITRTGR